MQWNFTITGKTIQTTRNGFNIEVVSIVGKSTVI